MKENQNLLKELPAGRNALVLSGGGARGGYHIGVWSALKELNIPIHIVTGTSVGAINAAMVAVDEFELAKKLWQEVETNMIFDLDTEPAGESEKQLARIIGMPAEEALEYAKKIVRNGGAGSTGMHKIIKKYVNKEEFLNSPVEFGLVVAELPSFKEHCFFKENIPNGLIHEYLVASASCFPAAHWCEIDGSKYVDGGYCDNLPVGPALEKNPDNIIAVDLEAVGVVKKETLRKAADTAKNFMIIKSPWPLGNFLYFSPDTAKRNLRLGYLDAMKALGVHEGHYYTFEKGEFKKHALMRADRTARFFDMDPLEIYTRESLNKTLAERIHAIKVSAKELSNPTKHAIRNFEKTKTVKAASKLFKNLNRTILVLHIAKHLKLHGENSFYLQRRVFRLLKTEVRVAAYLYSNNLV